MFVTPDTNGYPTTMPKSLGKKEQAERTRKRILDAAIRLFSKSGYVSTSMSDLAEAVKMSPGVLYWHFDDKEALLLATLDELQRRFAFEILSNRAEPLPDDPAARGRYMIGRVARVVENHNESLMLFGVIAAETTDANPRIERGLRRAYGAVAQIAVDLVRRGRDAGLCDPDVDVDCVAQLFLGIYMGGIMHQRLFREEIPLSRAMPELERMLFGAMFPRAGKLPPPRPRARTHRNG
jgi:AcrR family transcriptional regulator